MHQVCPVCQGRGTVQPGFYLASPGMVVEMASTAREQCRRCKGVGTIVITVRPRLVSGTVPHPPSLAERVPVEP